MPGSWSRTTGNCNSGQRWILIELLKRAIAPSGHPVVQNATVFNKSRQVWIQSLREDPRGYHYGISLDHISSHLYCVREAWVCIYPHIWLFVHNKESLQLKKSRASNTSHNATKWHPLIDRRCTLSKHTPPFSNSLNYKMTPQSLECKMLSRANYARKKCSSRSNTLTHTHTHLCEHEVHKVCVRDCSNTLERDKIKYSYSFSRLSKCNWSKWVTCG